MIRQKLRPGGVLLIQVPNYEQNPFDLVIVDHCTHFSPSTLSSLLARAGFHIEAAGSWIPKELTLVGRKSEHAHPAVPVPGNDATKVVDHVAWLHRVYDVATQMSRDRVFGIFGTSIAASWLCNFLGDRVAFFLDEDQTRVGRLYMSRPVYNLESVPKGAFVFLAQPSAIADEIRIRLEQRQLEFTFIMPPST
jgi:hypothetical protein